jgi:hypothetical protein
MLMNHGTRTASKSGRETQTARQAALGQPGGGQSPRRRNAALGVLIMLLTVQTVSAGMQEIMDAVKQSEFRFARSVSEVPFYPVGWAQNQFYPRTRFTDQNGGMPSVEVQENTLSLGLVLPVYVARRDMALVGADVAWDYLRIQAGPYADQSILRLTPVAAWLHQFGEKETVGAFVAPIFSKEMRYDQPWATSGYGGVIAIHWYSDEFQLLYGGVYEYSFGQNLGYPYLGFMWLPTPQWSLAVVFPWPTLTYAPRDRWLLQLGLLPGGSSWVIKGDDFETTQSLGSWNLTAGAGYRVYGKLWLFAGAGVAGLRGLEIEGGSNRSRFESNPSPEFPKPPAREQAIKRSKPPAIWSSWPWKFPAAVSKGRGNETGA